MAHFNVDSFKSYAIAAVASLYCSIMFLAAVGPSNLVALPPAPQKTPVQSLSKGSGWKAHK